MGFGCNKDKLRAVHACLNVLIAQPPIMTRLNATARLLSQQNEQLLVGRFNLLKGGPGKT